MVIPLPNCEGITNIPIQPFYLDIISNNLPNSKSNNDNIETYIKNGFNYSNQKILKITIDKVRDWKNLFKKN